MVEPLSPLAPVWRPGPNRNASGEAGVILAETRPGSIVQVTAWPGHEGAVRALIANRTGLDLPAADGSGAAGETRSAFGIGPGRFLVIDQAEGFGADLAAAVLAEFGAVTDLSHGRVVLRVSGAKAEWVLSKLFAIDFAQGAFPEGDGRATVHHDVLAQIQRTGPDRFDLVIFRSFARSFWTMLCHASEEVGYEVR